MPADGPNFHVDPKMLDITFHASMVTAYERHPETAKKVLEKAMLLNEEEVLKDVKPFTKKYGNRWIGRSNDIAGYVIKTNQRAIVVYRGTTTNFDTTRDMKYGKSKIHFGGDLNKGCWVHRGFKMDYLSSRSSLNAVLQDLDVQAPFPCYFSGHSLGGAVAQLAAADYAAKDEVHQSSVKGVYTYGTPRTFMKDESVMFYDGMLLDKTLHVMALGDPVIGIPPISYDFRHTGHNAMIPTLSSYGVSNHLIDSYEMGINSLKQDLSVIQQGDTICARRKELKKEMKQLEKEQKGTVFKIWDYVATVVLGTTEISKLWTDVISDAGLSSIYDTSDNKKFALSPYKIRYQEEKVLNNHSREVSPENPKDTGPQNAKPN